MNRPFFILLVILCFLSSLTSVFGQDPTRLHELVKPNCEGLLATLDMFTQVIGKDATAVGLIELTPGIDPISNAVYEKYLNRQIIRRRLNDRVQLRTNSPDKVLRITFSIGPMPSNPLTSNYVLSKLLADGNKPILFDSDLFEPFREDGRTNFVGLSCEACCFSSLDWEMLQEFLTANPRLSAYIIIRGSRAHRFALRRHLANEIRDEGLPSGRVRFLFANKNKINTNHFNEVAVFLSSHLFTRANQLPSEFDRIN